MEGEQWKIPKCLEGELRWKDGWHWQDVFVEVPISAIIIYPKNKRNLVLKTIPFAQIHEIIQVNKMLSKCFSIHLKTGQSYLFQCTDKSTESVQKWVKSLTHAKMFWDNKEILNQRKRLPATKVTTVQCEDGCIWMFFTLWNRELFGVLVNNTSTFSDVYPRLFHSHCACALCKIRYQSSKLYAVDGLGTKRLVGKDEALAEFGRQGYMMYVLEHGQKLLVVHYSDASYDVIPAPDKITAQEVLELQPVATKLKDLGCLNPGLYLKRETEEELLFHENDRTFQYPHGELVARSKTMTRFKSREKTKEKEIAELRRKMFVDYYQRRKTDQYLREHHPSGKSPSKDENNELLFVNDHFAEVSKPGKQHQLHHQVPNDEQKNVSTSHENNNDLVTTDECATKSKSPLPCGVTGASGLPTFTSATCSSAGHHHLNRADSLEAHKQEHSVVSDQDYVAIGKTDPGVDPGEMPQGLDTIHCVETEGFTEVGSVVETNNCPVKLVKAVVSENDGQSRQSLAAPIISAEDDNNSMSGSFKEMLEKAVSSDEIGCFPPNENTHQDDNSHASLFSGSSNDLCDKTVSSIFNHEIGCFPPNEKAHQDDNSHVKSLSGSSNDIHEQTLSSLSNHEIGCLPPNTRQDDNSHVQMWRSFSDSASNPRTRRKKREALCVKSPTKIRAVSVPDLREFPSNKSMVVNALATSVPDLNTECLHVHDVFSADEISDDSHDSGEFFYVLPLTAINDMTGSCHALGWQIAKKVEKAVRDILAANPGSQEVNELISNSLYPVFVEFFANGLKKSTSLFSRMFSRLDVWDVCKIISLDSRVAKALVSEIDRHGYPMAKRFLHFVRACIRGTFLSKWFELLRAADVQTRLAKYYEEDALILTTANAPCVEHMKVFLDRLDGLKLTDEIPPKNDSDVDNLLIFE